MAAIRAKHMMPNHAPLRLRLTTLLMKPMKANPEITMSKKVGQGKNMSQKLSPPPSGLPWYFMSVMKSLLKTKGTAQNEARRTAVIPTVSP